MPKTITQELLANAQKYKCFVGYGIETGIFFKLSKKEALHLIETFTENPKYDGHDIKVLIDEHLEQVTIEL